MSSKLLLSFLGLKGLRVSTRTNSLTSLHFRSTDVIFQLWIALKNARTLHRWKMEPWLHMELVAEAARNAHILAPSFLILGNSKQNYSSHYKGSRSKQQAPFFQSLLKDRKISHDIYRTEI